MTVPVSGGRRKVLHLQSYLGYINALKYYQLNVLKSIKRIIYGLWIKEHFTAVLHIELCIIVQWFTTWPPSKESQVKYEGL